MRWTRAGDQQIQNVRTALLSRTWRAECRQTQAEKPHDFARCGDRTRLFEDLAASMPAMKRRTLRNRRLFREAI